MNDETHENLRNGLFASTSAFEQANARTYPEPLVIPHSSAHTVLSHSEQLRKISLHLEDAQDLLAADSVEEAQDELRMAWEIAQDHA